MLAMQMPKKWLGFYLSSGCMNLTQTPFMGGTNLQIRTCELCLARLEGTNQLQLSADTCATSVFTF